MTRRWNAMFLIPAFLLGGCSSEPQTEVKPQPERVRIIQFYAAPAIVARGEPVTLCYGVENARAVRIEPAVETIKPSPNWCLQFAPKNSAKYKLVATGADGSEVSQSVAVQVNPQPAKKSAPAPPAAKQRMIVLFLASAAQVPLGQPVTMCYGVQNATSVRIEPNVRPLEPTGKRCFMIVPPQTTTYTLTATGQANETETQKLTITVN